MSPAAYHHLQDLAVTAVERLTRAQVFAAGRAYVDAHRFAAYKPPFEDFIYEQELLRLEDERRESLS